MFEVGFKAGQLLAVISPDNWDVSDEEEDLYLGVTKAGNYWNNYIPFFETPQIYSNLHASLIA